MIEHKFSLDMLKQKRIAPPRVTVRRGEEQTQKLIVNIKNDGSVYASDYENVRLRVQHADGTWAVQSAEKNSAVVSVVLAGGTLNGQGRCKLAYFEFYNDSDSETTQNFELIIEGNVDTSGEGAQDYSDELDVLRTQFEEWQDKAQTQESGRVEAETKRVEADAKREELVNQAISSALVAVESANGAVTNVNTAITSANTAVERANTAVTNAENASVKADEAVERVTTVTEQVETAESGRVEAENARVTAEDKRVQEFADMMSKANGLTVHLCVSGEYDTKTLKPTLTGDDKTLYLTPNSTSKDNDSYIEWLYISKDFERIGTTGATVEGVSTDTIDAIADGTTQTGEQVLQTTGLSYLWSKIRSIFAPLASPALTGTPTAPTATAGTSSTQIATTAFVADAINTAITEVENGTY